jgi:hypothetical protein
MAAVIRLLIDCGLRVGELTGVDVDDLDLDGESVTVVGKSRVRIAYFGNKIRPGPGSLPACPPRASPRRRPWAVPRGARPVYPGRCAPSFLAVPRTGRGEELRAQSSAATALPSNCLAWFPVGRDRVVDSCGARRPARSQVAGRYVGSFRRSGATRRGAARCCSRLHRY